MRGKCCPSLHRGIAGRSQNLQWHGSGRVAVAVIATFGHANNPVNGSYFLANGLQLWPSSGTSVALSREESERRMAAEEAEAA